jgi:hypothetical protein
MHPTVPFAAVVLFASTVFETCGNANAPTSTSTPTSVRLATCVPSVCSFSCVAALTSEGLPAHPAVNPNCPTGDFDNTTAEIAAWVTSNLASNCPEVAPGDVKLIPVPMALLCAEGTCAPNPNLLLPSCYAYCVTSGVPPRFASSCPSPDENPAMEQFVLDLEGVVCSDGQAADQASFPPDPALVDHTICMHRPRPHHAHP